MIAVREHGDHRIVCRWVPTTRSAVAHGDQASRSSSAATSACARPRSCSVIDGAGGVPGRTPRVHRRASGARGVERGVDGLLVARQPLTAPATNPSVSRFCAITKKTITGIVINVDAAMTAPQSVACWPKKRRRPTATV
jgi:hypothetical protein